MTTRRHIIRAAAAMPVLAALPAAAAACEVDPSIEAIKAYQEARRLYLAAIDRDEPEEEVDRFDRADCLAAVAALSTAPASLPGLRAFCEFGPWLLSEQRAGLGNWWPGNNLLVGKVDSRTGEEMYFATLLEAARQLLPA